MTLKERNERLEAEVNRLSEENSTLTESVAKLTAALASAERARDQYASDLSDARTQIAAAPEAAPEPDGPYTLPADMPRYLRRYTGTDPCDERIVGSEEEEKALQALEPDSWYQHEADARAAYHRREQAALSEDSDGTE